MNNNKPPHPIPEETRMSSTPVAPTHEPAPSNQFALLAQRRFAPFFWVQFFGAGNDNVFKFAFTVLVTYQLQVAWLPASMAGLVIGALFILPFLLFSATSGQLADKYPKEVLIRFVKSLEIAIMLLAGWGFVQQNVPLLLGCADSIARPCSLAQSTPMSIFICRRSQATPRASGRAYRFKSVFLMPWVTTKSARLT